MRERLTVAHTLTLPSLSTPDEAFITRARRGDPETIAEAYDAHQAAVCSFAKRLLGDDHAAEDLVQDVFLVLPSLVHRLQDGVSLRAFLLGIAANRARHHLRSRTRRRLFAQRLGSEPSAAVENPEQLSERRGLAAMLTKALELLPIDQRVTFVLREIEGYSAKEVAGMLGIPEATARTRLFHARHRLRSFLIERGAP